MKKLILGAVLLASAGIASVAVARDCVPPTTPSSIEASSDTSYENYGIYEWDGAQGAWVLLHAGYDPFYETEVLRGGDIWISESNFYAGLDGGDDGGSGMSVYKNNSGKDDQDPVLMSEPCKLPPVTVTGSRSSSGSGIIAMFWRGWNLITGGGSRGTAQRPKPVIKAPSTTQPITCTDDPSVRIGNAQHALARSGIGGWPRFRGREFTIEYSTGTTETYTHLGSGYSDVWLAIKAGTCKNK